MRGGPSSFQYILTLKAIAQHITLLNKIPNHKEREEQFLRWFDQSNPAVSPAVSLT